MREEQKIHPVAWLPEDWSTALREAGERPFRAAQVFRWIHTRCQTDPAKMTDLSAPLRDWLIREGLSPQVEATRIHSSVDGTRKVLVTLKDGSTIETVLIPGVSGPSAQPSASQDADAAAADHDEDPEEAVDSTVRVTQCISTQVGCAMGCVFCASGVAGLKRHLSAAEIVGQVLLGKSLLPEGQRLRSVVLMGMGEPLHNYEATARALKLMVHPDGIGLSSRRVTVSTSGLVPEIERLGKDFGGQIGLAISLHAADDETRSKLMPINRKYPLERLMQALRDYPLPRRRRITIEYTLVSGKNDTPEEARKVGKLLRGLPVKINLIPMNPIEASSLHGPDRKRVEGFQNVLVEMGYSCFIRTRRGDDVSAACGQLALLGAKPKVRVQRD